MNKLGTNTNSVYPNENIKSVCFIKNSNIQVGEYTYYSDINGAANFENLESLCSSNLEEIKHIK